MKSETNMKQIMSIKLNIACLLVAVIVAGCASEEKENHNADLKPQATITEAQARATAMAKVPDATIKEAELEKEHGKLIWSMDISKPNAEGISEINIDAMTGDIVSIEK